jgi:eukaryotic-like serine/threonine-protein kinase
MTRSKPTQMPDPLEIGARLLDRYSIIERISSGGHSVVYRGEDERLHRPVCIKVFQRVKSGDGPYQTAYEHFVQEAFALSKLTHPNTLRIYDFGHLPDRGDEMGPPFQVSEFMTHGTLWSHVRQNGPVPAGEAVPIILALGGALGEAHQAGIIHRDIKPHNILFTAAGRHLVVKLADFGIAKALPGETADLRHRADDTSVVVGRPFLMYSPWWAAPEQLAGMQVGPEADVFALALSVIYMLTANVVFRENDPIKSYEQRKSGPALAEASCADTSLPDRVVALLAQACAFDTEERPHDAESFATELADGLRRNTRATSPMAVPPVHDSVHDSVHESMPLPPPLPPAPAPNPLRSHTMDRGLAVVPDSTPVHAPLPLPPPPPGPAEAYPQAYPHVPTPAPMQAQAPAAERPHPHLQPIPGAGSPMAEGMRPGPGPRRLRLADDGQMLAERRVGFVPAPNGEATLACLGGSTKLRVGFVPANEGFFIHIRGLTCFVAHDRGRPSSAAQFDSDGTCHLVLPNRMQIGVAQVSLGKAAAGHRIFTLGEQPIAVSLDECPQVAVLDFGPGSDYLVVYRADPRTADARKQKKAQAQF